MNKDAGVGATMAVKIRPIVYADAAGYRACWEAIAKERTHLFEFEVPPLAQVRKTLRWNLRKKNPFLVAVDGARVVGLAFVVRRGFPSTDHQGEFGIRLLPAYRGIGLGTKLAARVLKLARGKFESVILGVLGKNKPAQKLFKKMGFETVGRAKKGAKMPYGYDDQVFMQIQLPR